MKSITPNLIKILSKSTLIKHKFIGKRYSNGFVLFLDFRWQDV